MLAANTVLQRRYRITRKLSHGGMGAVYEAVDERISTVVALKETFAQNELEREAFEREAKLLGNLDHPAFPRVMDHFTEGDGQFLVMQFIKGEDLLERLRLRGNPFPPDQVIEWADQLLDALEDLHDYKPPIIHRDIKPSNLKLNRKGRIILLDFGIAKGAAGQMSTLETDYSMRGYTPNYAPPEQIVRADARWVEALSILNAAAVTALVEKGTDARSDLYSLGATLYHLMTNEVPTVAPTRALALWSGKPEPLRSAHEVNDAISPEVAAVLNHSMALDRNQRPASATAMRQELREAMAASPYQAPVHIPPTIAAETSAGRPTREAGSESERDAPQSTEASIDKSSRPNVLGPTRPAELLVGTIRSPFTPSATPAVETAKSYTSELLTVPQRRMPRWSLLVAGFVGLLILALAAFVAVNKFGAEPLPLRQTISNNYLGVFSIAFSPDGKILAVGNDKAIELRDVQTGDLKETLQASSEGLFGNARIRAVAYSPDGKMLAGAAPDGFLKLWEIPSGNFIAALSDQIDRLDKSVNVIAFSPDGQTLAVGLSKGMDIWDVGTKKLRLTLPMQSGEVYAIAFSPDGKTLAVGNENEVELRDSQTGYLLQSLKAHKELIESVAFSRDGELLASGSGDKTVCLWDAKTGNLKQTLSGGGEVNAVALSPNGRMLVGASGNEVRLWDVRNGELKLTLPITNLDGPVRAIAFSPDGRTLATGGKVDTGSNDKAKGEVKLWDVSGLN